MAAWPSLAALMGAAASSAMSVLSKQPRSTLLTLPAVTYALTLQAAAGTSQLQILTLNHNQLDGALQLPCVVPCFW